MHRVYCPNINFETPIVTISDPKEIHHLKNVLLLKKEATVQIFNGRGDEADAVIQGISSNKIDIKILSNIHRGQSKNRWIILACAIPKKAKFEAIIEKATELGVDEIIPLQTERTEVILSDAKIKSKIERYHSVAVNAAKQSKRPSIPTIHAPIKFADFVKTINSECIAVIPCLSEKQKNIVDVLSTTASRKKNIFIIGPEGDFTAGEITLAQQYGCIPVSLGNNVLKVDTAAISVVALAHFNNFSP